MKTLFRILKISLIITLVVIGINIVFNDFDFERFLDVKTLGIYYFYTFMISGVNASFYGYFNRKFGWDTNVPQRIIMASTGSIVLTIATYFVCRLIHLVVFTKKYSLTEFWAQEQFAFYLFPLLFTIAITLVFYLIYFYKALQEQKVKQQKIIAGTANAQFDALKNQLDPHFLFNSLNVLAALIEEDPEKAQQFTGSLSKVYRYVLEQKNKDLVSVAEELQFARIYIDLLKMRFEDAIAFEISEEIQESEAKVVPLALQLLLENTVKHNKVMESSPLKISIYKSQNMLVIKNNLQPKEILKNSSGVGLVNIKERYKLLTRRQVEILTTSDEFIVRLPLLTKQTREIPMKTNIEDKSASYLRAKEQMEKEKGFYGNLTGYCMVIGGLALLNYFTGGFPWVIFPAIGWGIGLLFHGLSAFDYNPFFSKDWEARKIKQIMDKNQ